MQPILSIAQPSTLTAAYNSNGNYFVSAGRDRTIRLWSSSSGALIKPYSGGHNYEITSLGVSPDNTKLASSGLDCSVVLWDVTKGSAFLKLQSHKKKVNSLHFHSLGSLIFSAADDSTCKVWDLREKQPIETLTASKDSVLKVSANTDQVIAVSADGCIQTYDVRCGVIYIDYLKELVLEADIGKEGEIVASTHADNVLRITDRSAGRIIAAFEQANPASDYVTPCAIMKNLRVVVGDQTGEVAVYDIEKGPVNKWQAHQGQVVKIIAHPLDPQVFLSVSQNEMCVWNMKS